MKKTLTVFAVLAALAVAPAAMAQEKHAFGVIDMNRIMKETTAAKGIFTEVEAKRKEYETQIQKEGDKLAQLEKDIIGKKAKMSEAEFNTARTDFEDKIGNAQKMVQDRKSKFDTAVGGAVDTLRAEAAKITAAVAKERGYSAVVTQEAVVLAEPELDVTDEVVKRLNANLKKVPIKW